MVNMDNIIAKLVRASVVKMAAGSAAALIVVRAAACSWLAVGFLRFSQPARGQGQKEDSAENGSVTEHDGVELTVKIIYPRWQSKYLDNSAFSSTLSFFRFVRFQFQMCRHAELPYT